MPNQHKRPPLALRLPEGLEAWYRAEASKRGMALNALAVEALTAFREVVTTPAAVPADRVTTTPREARAQPAARPIGYPKERQAGRKKR